MKRIALIIGACLILAGIYGGSVTAGDIIWIEGSGTKVPARKFLANENQISDHDKSLYVKWATGSISGYPTALALSPIGWAAGYGNNDATAQRTALRNCRTIIGSNSCTIVDVDRRSAFIKQRGLSSSSSSGTKNLSQGLMSDSDKQKYLDWVHQDPSEVSALALDASGCWKSARGRTSGPAKRAALEECAWKCKSKTCRIVDLNGKSEFIRQMVEAEAKEKLKKEKEELKRKEEERRRLAAIEKERAKERKKLADAIRQLIRESKSRLTQFLSTEQYSTLDGIERFLSEEKRASKNLQRKQSELVALGKTVAIKDMDWTPIANRYLSLLFDHYRKLDVAMWPSLNNAIDRMNSNGIPSTVISEYPVSIYILDRNRNPKNDEKTFQVDLNYQNLPAKLTNLQIKKVELHALGETLKNQGEKYAIVVDVSDRVVSRDVTSHEKIISEYQFGEDLVPNPKYRRFQMDYLDVKEMYDHYNNQQASCNASRCIIRCCWNCWKMCKLFKEWSAKHSVARQKFYSIDEFIKQPRYQPYNFRKTDIKIEKKADLRILAFDNNSQLIEKSKESFERSKTFSVLYGLHDKDKDPRKHKKGTVTEEAASTYEEKSITVSFLQVIDKALDGSGAVQVPMSAKDFVAGLIQDQSEERKVGDEDVAKGDSGEQNFRSVVIVIHPGGSIGSGFYVNEDTVLTNYHVVEGTKFLEIGLYDGSDTFGKVTAKDIRLDLALIKVQKPGTPLKFYTGNKIKIGSTADAIGHPEGLEFSLTRGTISGIRRLPSLYDPGGKAVRFIQSDVAINEGNSGGPLLLGNEVIGVNDWKLADTNIEGLGFSIHYSEVRKFLKKHDL